MDISKDLLEKAFFHGSLEKVDNPSLTTHLANPFSDFGCGFYLTTNFEQSKEWGKKKALEKNINTYKVNQYHFRDISGLSIKFFEIPDREWLEAVHYGRKGYKLAFDIVVGPVADGPLLSVFKQFENKKKLAGNLSETDLVNLEYQTIKLLNVNKQMNQYALLNEKAINKLIFDRVYIYDIYSGLIRKIPSDKTIGRTR